MVRVGYLTGLSLLGTIGYCGLRGILVLWMAGPLVWCESGAIGVVLWIMGGAVLWISRTI